MKFCLGIFSLLVIVSFIIELNAKSGHEESSTDRARIAAAYEAYNQQLNLSFERLGRKIDRRRRYLKPPELTPELTAYAKGSFLRSLTEL